MTEPTIDLPRCSIPGPALALVVESVACPAIRKVTGECLTAWAQLMEALVAERRPDRPVPPMGGTVAIGAIVYLPATAIEEDRDVSSMSGILAGTTYRLLLA
ncbi:hypothetical protein [Streptomyces sp. NBC_00271]|uniref:hypothetical protein n=1 Tax=Streptomyces sp. NBC_00271 TaxID=2975697 RepID=UPI002E2B01E6|nr:hypothetical protein [Streptomyces sp. NBC_00271]